MKKMRYLKEFLSYKISWTAMKYRENNASTAADRKEERNEINYKLKN